MWLQWELESGVSDAGIKSEPREPLIVASGLTSTLQWWLRPNWTSSRGCGLDVVLASFVSIAKGENIALLAQDVVNAQEKTNAAG